MSAKGSPVSAPLVSMTGFGRCSLQRGSVSIEVEIRSVNHRFLDLNIKLPRPYSQLESRLRELVTAELPRGRVELFVARTAAPTSSSAVNFHAPLFKELLQVYAQALGKKVSSLQPEERQALTVEILSRREVLEIGDQAQFHPSEETGVVDAVKTALKELQQMRAKEGAALGAEVRGRLATLRKLKKQIEKSGVTAPQQLRDRLLKRIERLAADVVLDPGRLEAEIALFADRIDTTEELVRLDSHFTQFEEVLHQPSSGRKLDFIVQEMGREMNTITSKAQDARIQGMVIEAKAELEKIKEQVQNIQ